MHCHWKIWPWFPLEPSAIICNRYHKNILDLRILQFGILLLEKMTNHTIFSKKRRHLLRWRCRGQSTWGIPGGNPRPCTCVATCATIDPVPCTTIMDPTHPWIREMSKVVRNRYSHYWPPVCFVRHGNEEDARQEQASEQTLDPRYPDICDGASRWKRGALDHSSGQARIEGQSRISAKPTRRY